MALQIPPAVGSSGQFVETVIVTSSQQRHVMVVGDGISTAYGPVTSSGGQLVAVSNPSTAVTVVGTVPIVSASSGLVQISGTPTVLTASSGYLIRSLSSGTVTLSSNPTVVLSSPTSLSSGIVSPSSNWTVISTATTLTSGTVTLSSAPLVIVASSGGTQIVAMSSVQTVTLSSATSLSSGTVTLSSNPTVVSASSGVIQLSSAPLVIVATSGGQITVTNVSASSGVVQVLQSTGTAGGVTSTYLVLSTVKGIKTAAGRLMGYSAYATALTSAGSAPLLVFFNMTSANVVVGTSQALIAPLQVFTTGTATSLVDIVPLPPTWFGPNGLDFATAITAASAITATGIGHATNVYLSVFYT